MFTKGSYDEVAEKLSAILGDLTSVQAGLDELKQVTDILETKKTSNFIIDLMIIRGLDYYTRTVFEFKSENVGFRNHARRLPRNWLHRFWWSL